MLISKIVSMVTQMMSSSKGLDLGYTVTQAVETLRYTRVRFPMGLLEFFIDLILSAARTIRDILWA
jgi:hypothetical protein